MTDSAALSADPYRDTDVIEGPLEDSRPPRLANFMGIAFLGLAAATWWLGAEAVGTALGALVAGLALLAATTGFCAGCEVYRLTARLRGISPRHHDRIDPSDLPGLDGAREACVASPIRCAPSAASGRRGCWRASARW